MLLELGIMSIVRGTCEMWASNWVICLNFTGLLDHGTNYDIDFNKLYYLNDIHGTQGL